jgi:hypothetical protein
MKALNRYRQKEDEEYIACGSRIANTFEVDTMNGSPRDSDDRRRNRRRPSLRSLR